MNIDSQGLNDIYQNLLKGIPYFEKAHDLISSLDSPPKIVNASMYKMNMEDDILQCMREAEDLCDELETYLSELEEMNQANQELVDMFGEGINVSTPDMNTDDEEKGGFFEGVIGFFGKLLDSVSESKAREQQQNLYASSAIARLFGDEELADNMIAAGDMAVEAAQQSKENETGARMIYTGINSLIAGAKGIYRVGEATLDGLMMLAAQKMKSDLINSAYTMGVDSETRDALLKTGDDIVIDTMRAVEVNNTDKKFAELYSKDLIKNINDKSYIKEGDAIYTTIEGITYYIPIAVVDAIAPGAGTAISFMAGSGKAQQEVLTNMKMNSKEGIREEYEAGNISQEEYDKYVEIWNMPDEYLEYMHNNAFKMGIPFKEIEYMKTIKNMPKEWATQTNANKSNAIGAATGIWEATQWLAGKGLNKMESLKGSQAFASATRIGADTGFNALDTAFRSGVASLVLGTEFTDEFENRGGWESVGIDVAIGFVGSGIGEFMDFGKRGANKNEKNNLNNNSNSVNTLQTILNTSDFNKNNLINGIIESLPEDLDNVTKARMIYLKLNQAVSYSEDWWLVSSNNSFTSASSIYRKKFDISNMDSNKVVCSSWSKIYSDLLQASGFDAEKVSIYGSGDVNMVHNWVKINLGDGKIILADATNPIRGRNDLANVKLGAQTSGFIVTTEEDFNKTWQKMKDKRSKGKLNKGVQMATFEVLMDNKNVKNNLTTLDQNTGYSNNKYLQEIEETFSSGQELSIDEKIETFIKHANSKEYSVLEFCEFANKYKMFLGDNVKVSVEQTFDRFNVNVSIVNGDERIILHKCNDEQIEILK